MKSNAQREQLLQLRSNIADLSEMCNQHVEWDRLLFSCAAVKKIRGPILHPFAIEHRWAEFKWAKGNMLEKRRISGYMLQWAR